MLICFRLFVLLFSLLWVGCSSSNRVKDSSLIDGSPWNREARELFIQGFEKHLQFQKDTEVEVYLRGMAEELARATTGMKESAVGVWLIRNVRGKWRSFGIPSIRLYLPTEVLANLEFENEVASLMAIQIGHLSGTSLARNVIHAREVNESERGDILIDPYSWMNYLGPSGVFSFSEEDEFIAYQKAVQILYGAGYDIRGLISILALYEKYPEHSPYEKSTLVKLTEYVRQQTSAIAPLRNPIVKTHAFYKIRNKLKKFKGSYQ